MLPVRPTEPTTSPATPTHRRGPESRLEVAIGARGRPGCARSRRRPRRRTGGRRTSPARRRSPGPACRSARRYRARRGSARSTCPGSRAAARGEGGRAEALGDPAAIERPDDARAVAVALGPAQDERRIPVGRVVAEQRALPVVRRAVRLQVGRGGRDGVGWVADVGIRDPASSPPGRSRLEELHRAAGAGLVRLAAVAVAAVVVSTRPTAARTGQSRPNGAAASW